MKILNRAQFMALDHQVLYCKYAPHYFEQLEIKVENCGDIDFFCLQLNNLDCQSSSQMFDLLESTIGTDKSLKMDFLGNGRDGCFDDDQLFAVYERQDLEQLIARLQTVLNTMPSL